MKSRVRDFPGTLILQRKSISQFSNGPKVALYYADKLKKYFTVTLDDKQQLQSEDFLSMLENFDEDVTEISFNDDTKLNINKECSNLVLEYLNNINIEEKEILEQYILESSDNFLEVLEIAVNNKE
jgi:hypothetical protein